MKYIIGLFCLCILSFTNDPETHILTIRDGQLYMNVRCHVSEGLSALAEFATTSDGINQIDHEPQERSLPCGARVEMRYAIPGLVFAKYAISITNQNLNAVPLKGGQSDMMFIQIHISFSEQQPPCWDQNTLPVTPLKDEGNYSSSFIHRYCFGIIDFLFCYTCNR